MVGEESNDGKGRFLSRMRRGKVRDMSNNSEMGGGGGVGCVDRGEGGCLQDPEESQGSERWSALSREEEGGEEREQTCLVEEEEKGREGLGVGG
jgi:hypothetical protein